MRKSNSIAKAKQIICANPPNPRKQSIDVSSNQCYQTMAIKSPSIYSVAKTNTMNGDIEFICPKIKNKKKGERESRNAGGMAGCKFVAVSQNFKKKLEFHRRYLKSDLVQELSNEVWGEVTMQDN